MAKTCRFEEKKCFSLAFVSNEQRLFFNIVCHFSWFCC